MIDRTLVTLLDASGDVVAVLPAQVRWSLKLTRPDELVQVRIPWEYLLSDGTLLSKVSALDTGWYALWDGGKYVVGDVDTDNESGLTFDALSAETDDLGNLYTNYSGGPATYINMLPTDIADAILSGQVGRPVKNAGFGILDTSDLPTNWSHPAGWTSKMVSNRRVWQADAGSEESYSDDLPCTPGVAYRVKVNASAASTTGTRGVKFRWILSDGSTVDSAVTNLAVEDGAFHEVDTGGVVALGTRLRIVLKTAGTAHVSQFDDVRLYEIGPDSGYTYTGYLDARDAAVPYTDGAYTKYGVWTEGASYLESTAVGDYVARIVNGPFVTVEFAAGGAGASAKVKINGIQYQASGSSLVRGTAPIDVSTAKSLTASGLDPANDHIVEVEVDAVKVRFEGLTVSTDNLISMKWDDKTLYEALWSIAKAVGGELVFDAAAGTVTHLSARGQDLKANNIVEFRRGLNVIRMARRESRGKLVNRLTYIGYGEGQYMLRVTVDATGTNDSGDTSQDVYGIRRGVYINKECKSLATATAEAQRLVEESCWPQRSYDVQVTDEVADLLTPGDVGHFVYRDINEDLRILEITRTTDGGPAALVVARTSDPLVDQIVAAGKQLATLQKSYQGVPSDSNMYFSEQFERTSGGTDTPATVDFFIPYGADLLDLRLRYQVGGLRAYAKGAASGGGSTSGDGGGTTVASASGGSSTPTSGDASTPSGGGSTTPSGGGSTSGSGSQAVVTSPGTSRSIEGNTTNAWATVAAWGLNSTNYPTQVVMVGIFNRSGASRTFNLEVGTTYGGDDVFTSTPIVGNNSVVWESYALSGGTLGDSMFARLQPGTTSSSNYDFTVLIVGYASHTHTTPAHTHSTPDHTHPAHSHTVTIGSHTHNVTVADHAHTVPAHTHALTYGIYESSTPATVRLYLDGALITALNDSTYVSDFDLLPYVTKDSNGRVAEGWHTLAWKSATAGATGRVRGTVFARKFIATEAA
jgi:hypothetical protein